MSQQKTEEGDRAEPGHFTQQILRASWETYFFVLIANGESDQALKSSTSRDFSPSVLFSLSQEVQL